MGIVVTDGRLQWHQESERHQCDESEQRRWDSLSGYLGVDFWLLSVAVWVTFFPSDEFGSKFWSHTRRNWVLYYFF